MVRITIPGRTWLRLLMVRVRVRLPIATQSTALRSRRDVTVRGDTSRWLETNKWPSDKRRQLSRLFPPCFETTYAVPMWTT